MTTKNTAYVYEQKSKTEDVTEKTCIWQTTTQKTDYNRNKATKPNALDHLATESKRGDSMLRKSALYY